MSKKISRGLILSGGGARAAYQAGVLRHILEISKEPSGKIPFEILVGVSAGAINLAALAANASSFETASSIMSRNWANITTSRVFDARAVKIFFNSLRWLIDLGLGGVLDRPEPHGRSLVDTAPLLGLLQDLLPRDAIAQHIRDGVLEAVAISATDYDTKALTVFVEAQRNRTLWRRFSRVARYAQITPEHILASCALPVLFPAVLIGNAYYGDGSIRNMAPLSPAIHLGARKVLAVGVREPVSPFFEHTHTDGAPAYPSLAKISGILLDSIFLDALEMDREQMTRVNRLLEEIPGGITDDRGVRLSSVEFLYVGPSRDLAAFAVKHREEMPRAVRYMLKGLGAEREGGGELLSYLLFEAGYCGELMDLGYKDAVAQSSELQNFLWSD